MRDINQEIYIEKGYKNRRDYLLHLAIDNGVPYDVVRALANKLGAEHDFDALVKKLEELGE